MAVADAFYQGLRELSNACFPKCCDNCGVCYTTAEDYIRKTERIAGQSGLKESYDGGDSPIVELLRNCSCGYTLTDRFNSRRDLSEEGLRRRETFGRLVSCPA